jgi:hypothetical protein
MGLRLNVRRILDDDLSHERCQVRSSGSGPLLHDVPDLIWYIDIQVH